MARRLPILDFHPHYRISRGHLLDSVLGAYTIAECEWRRSPLLALPPHSLWDEITLVDIAAHLRETSAIFHRFLLWLWAGRSRVCAGMVSAEEGKRLRCARRR